MKKGKVILIFVIVIIVCSSVPIILNRTAIERNMEAYKLEQEEKEKYEAMLKADEVAPILILTQDKITIYQGDEINYKSFIKEASDNLEGDLTSKIKYEKIDTKKAGEYYIDYEISDTASNVTKARMQVVIKQKPNFKY